MIPHNKKKSKIGIKKKRTSAVIEKAAVKALWNDKALQSQLKSITLHYDVKMFFFMKIGVYWIY